MDKFPQVEQYKRIIILLVSFLISNPIILFLLFKSIVWTIVIWISITLLIFIVWEVSNNSWIKVYTINFLALLSIFLHIELVFRIAYADYIIEDLYTIEKGFYFNKPLLNRILEDKEYKAVYRTNNQGFRISQVSDENIIIGHCDWLFLGDSYTQGAQVEFENLFTSALFYHFPDKVIINAGISGFGLPEMYSYYKKSGYQLKPKKIFLQICNFNDFMNVEEKNFNFIDYLMHYSDFARSLLYSLKYKQPDALPLGRWTEPFYKEYQNNIDYNIFFKTAGERKKRDLTNFTKYLALLNNEIKNNGSELIVFQIPTKEQIYFKYFEEVIREFEIDVDELDMNYPNKFLKQLTEELDIKYLDMQSDLATNEGSVFFDYDEHFNKEGHRVTAEILAKFLAEDEPLQHIEFLSKGFNGDRYPNVSVYDSSIIYQSFRHNNMEIFKADLDLKNAYRLSYNDIDEGHPVLSEDGNFIVFTEGKPELSRTKIVKYNINTDVRFYITENENEYGAIPDISNDNKKIVYAGWFELKNTLTNPSIIIYDLTTNLKEEIVDDKAENWRPVFGPGDSLLAFIRKIDSNFNLFLINIVTREVERLITTNYDIWDPKFSPDGKFIIYAAKEEDRWNIYEMNLSTRKILTITNSYGNDWDPCYAIDGNYIYYAGEYGIMNGIFRIKK